jgi:hypothetical protein
LEWRKLRDGGVVAGETAGLLRANGTVLRRESIDFWVSVDIERRKDLQRYVSAKYQYVEIRADVQSLIQLDFRSRVLKDFDCFHPKSTINIRKRFWEGMFGYGG